MANRLITEGDKIDLKDILSKEQLNGGLTPATYASQVFEIRNDDILRVSMPIEHGRIIPLSKGKKFDAFFYTAKGLYQCRVIIIDRFKINNIYMMDIELLTEPVKYQRRQYYRLELNIPVRYMQVTETESNMMANEEELPERLGNLSEYYSGDTIDISGGGLRFTGDGFVEKGNKLAVVFDIDYEGNIERYVLAADVVMSFAVPQQHGMYEHRVEFRNISKEHREMLIKYIFQEERKIRKNNR